MKTSVRHIINYLLLGMMIASCSATDDMAEQVIETPQPQAKQVDLLVSLGNGAQNTRQALTQSPSMTTR